MSKIPVSARPAKGGSGASTTPNGNTQGRVNGEAPASGKAAEDSNPPVEAKTGKEVDTGDKMLDGLQTTLDVVGLVPGVGEIADLANAGISLARGDFVGAGLSLVSAIPFAGWLGTAGKVGRRGAKAAEEASARATKEAAERAAKEAAEKKARDAAQKKAKEEAEKKAADEAAKNAQKKKNLGGKGKGRKKLKCGEYGKYGELKKKNGKGKFDRDHIPSKAALKARAEALKGEPLTKAEAKAIEKWGNSIAVPRQAHIDISPTYGQSLASAANDARDLAGSARRDVEAMLEKIDQYDADGGCKKAYKKAAKRVLKDNKWFDTKLNEIIKPK
ncbi:hypothetical protein ABXK61_13490 [Burkholderia sola]|uniref:hypothetical protein n=1 Tax=Burkholderia TaxID=32008 RepID=UPI001AE65327|nr:hypothetical protein [Burkholderia sp. AcTa6-5]MBP0714327.1 hypothetical protein [Burkholderia sp. AcTa6-5]